MGFPCSQNTLFSSGSRMVCSRMLALCDIVNISNEKGSSLRVFALFCTAFGTIPSPDGLFINISEGWWHWGLFNTSAWGGDRPWATNTLWMCFANHLNRNDFSNRDSSATTSQTHSEWKCPKRVPFSGPRLYYSGGKWNPCFRDTVRVEMRDTASLSSGNHNYLWTMQSGLSY